MAPEHEAAFEAQEEVLAHCLDALQATAVQLLGNSRRSRARVRRLDLDLLTDERLQAPCGTVDRVPFGHDWIVLQPEKP